MKRRGQPKEDPREHGNGAGVEEDPGTQADLVCPGKFLGHDGYEALDAEVSEAKAKNPTQEGHHAGLGEELAHDAAAPGAQGTSKGHFSIPAGGMGKKEVGHVGAGDEEHEEDPYAGDEGPGLESLVEDPLVKGQHTGTVARAGFRVLRGDLPHDLTGLAQSLLPCEPIPVPGENREEVTVTGFLARDGERGPHVLARVEVPEAFGHDSNHRVGHSIQKHG
jgi:hypothetical protein